MAFICEPCDWIGDLPEEADKVCPNCGEPVADEDRGSKRCGKTTMTEQEALAAIKAGDSAYNLLLDVMPKALRRFNAIDRLLIRLLADVREHFPDAEYYTASGGFNLMIGKPHSQGYGNTMISQQQLIAFGGLAAIGDGDF